MLISAFSYKLRYLGEGGHVLALHEEAGVVADDEPLDIGRHSLAVVCLSRCNQSAASLRLPSYLEVKIYNGNRHSLDGWNGGDTSHRSN